MTKLINKEVYEHIIPLLKDDVWQVRSLAIKALESIVQAMPAIDVKVNNTIITYNSY